MSMQTESAPGTGLPTFLVPFASIHAAMRRDAARLERAVAACSGPDHGAALSTWWQRYAGVIEHHHCREDDVVWPDLERRDPAFAVHREVLLSDHHDLDDAMVRMAAALALVGRGGPVEEAQAAAAEFSTVLLEHLAREEAAAFPAIAEHYTPEEYRAVERELQKGSSLSAAAFELPWVLDEAAPETLEALAHMVPAPMKVLHRLSWQRSYRRVAAPILAVA